MQARNDSLELRSIGWEETKGTNDGCFPLGQGSGKVDDVIRRNTGR
jgi:hypothetical protein